MNTMILRVKKCGAMTTVQSEKSENGVLNKRTLVLQELGGKYEDSYVVTALGNLATIEWAEGELVVANLRGCSQSSIPDSRVQRTGVYGRNRKRTGKGRRS